MVISRRNLVYAGLASVTSLLVGSRVWRGPAGATGVAVPSGLGFLRGQARSAVGRDGEALAWLQSYVPTSALNLGETGFTYDIALAIFALLAGGEQKTAQALGNALLYVQAHDPDQTDGRLRDAYTADRFVTSAGAVATIRSVSTGNLSWAGLALLRLHAVTQQPNYLQGAVRIGDWLLAHTTNGDPGPQAPDIAYGVHGGISAQGASVPWKSTEHNADAYALFSRLAAQDPAHAPTWQKAAAGILRFFHAVKQQDGHFCVGTTDNTTLNRGWIALDAQTFPLMALPADLTTGTRDYTETHLHTAGFPDGYAFAMSDLSGVWYEGTAQMAVAVGAVQVDEAHYSRLRATLQVAQLPSGALPAASKDRLLTGDGGNAYYKSPHVGATAWALMAELRHNPLAAR